jgi:hypothetical protein
VLLQGELAQDLAQILRAKLGSSTGAVGQAGQPDGRIGHGGLLSERMGLV